MHWLAVVFANISGLLKAEDIANASHFRTMRGTREFAVNDRIIFLENAKFEERAAPKLGVQAVKNGMLATVLETKGDVLKVRLDSGREVVFSQNSYTNIDHGYATTIHKSQGVTVDNSFVLASSTMDQHLSYVAMSRHKETANLYVAEQDFKNVRAHEHRDLAEGIKGQVVETGSVQFDPSSETMTPYVDLATKRGIERLYGVNLPQSLKDNQVGLGDTIKIG